MSSLFKVFLKDDLWRDLASSLNECQIFVENFADLKKKPPSCSLTADPKAV